MFKSAGVKWEMNVMYALTISHSILYSGVVNSWVNMQNIYVLF